jgi:integrase/recombinase XerD
MTSLAPTLQAFFTDRLAQRQASPHTIAAYRDTLRLLVVFAAERAGTEPCELDIADLDAPMIGAFLDHLQQQRRNSARTRNARLAAIHSMFRFAALRHPEHAADIQRVLAIPPKRAAARSSATSPSPRSPRSSPRRTAQPGPAGATTRCSRSPSRPGCAPPNSPV